MRDPSVNLYSNHIFINLHVSQKYLDGKIYESISREKITLNCSKVSSDQSVKTFRNSVL